MLDYLFVAETLNHNIIRQTQADISIKDPKRSAFYDVSLEKIRKFSLVGKGHMISIDLFDGHAEIDGRILYPPKQPPMGITRLELIYYRQVQQRIVVGPDGHGRLDPIIRYYIGWQCNYKGKNHKWELGID